jgi:uncharacterized protein DUF1579
MSRTFSKQRVFLVGAAMILSAFAALPAFSQAPAPSGPPTPAPELAQLSFFAGDWTCQGKAEASPMGPAHATAGKVHISNDVGGFWYVGHYAEQKTAENPHPMVFHFLQGYDASTKTFVMDCYDAFGGHCHGTSSGWQGDKLVYTGESSGAGPAMPVRDVFTKTGDASLEHAGEMQIEGKWIATDHETCTRVKK